MTEHRPTNRLAAETSPYLLQHAHNPVDWFPWGAEALERARTEDRPLFVSIGYAACHWCHVMERESFEDEETAAILNERFVPIKVDREERPDVDAIYMDAAQALTGHGGWPLNAFCAPDGTPFYVGTYFPPEDRPGMPSFRRVLTGIDEAWRGRRQEILGQGRRVLDAISRTAALESSGDPLSEDPLRAAHARLRQAFDETWGGFGGAPKFPQPMTLEFLLRCHVRGYPDALAIVERTLDRMAGGGIRDHVGGGFARYSTDARWHVPHFEKMLYDNAQLARLYLHAWQATGEDRHRRVAEETLDYLLRELQHTEGGFFSSQDADSEGVEGRFFVWSYEELVALAGEHVAAVFGAAPGGNWEGTNVLWTPLPIGQVAYELSLPEADLARDVEDARARLFEARERRVRPGTDDKILAGWNGLAISAFAQAGRALGRADYRDEAVRAAEFVLTHLRDDRRRLLRSWRNGRAGRPGFADDHALLASACLDLYEATFDLRWFREARELAGELVRLFHDAERGGFFQTGVDAEELVVRPKELIDNAVPSANSAAAEILQRLAHLTGDVDLERAGVSALRLVRDHLGVAPTGFGHALSALDLYLGPAREVALVGDPDSEDMRALLDVVRSGYRPNVVLALASSHEPEASEEIPLLAERTQLDERATAYVCERFACKLPVSEPAALAEQLDG